jgi:hypothetical protein
MEMGLLPNVTIYVTKWDTQNDLKHAMSVTLEMIKMNNANLCHWLFTQH